MINRYRRPCIICQAPIEVGAKAMFVKVSHSPVPGIVQRVDAIAHPECLSEEKSIPAALDAEVLIRQEE